MLRTCLALLTSACLLGSCYSTPNPQCAFLCGEANSCPDNYSCATDGWCKRNDINPDFDCMGTTVDARVVDAPIIDAPIIDADIDASGDGDGDGDDD